LAGLFVCYEFAPKIKENNLNKEILESLKFLFPTNVDCVSSISSLRAIGPMGRWPEIDDDKKYPDNPFYPTRVFQ
jgi:hypothetical protein